jgi:hypothetical protein
VRRPAVIVALSVLLLVGAVTAAAQDPAPPPPATTGSTVPVQPAPVPPPPTPAVVPEGVTIAGVAIGGLAPADAAVAVQTAFDQPLQFVHGKRRWQATVAELGARAYVEGAVKRALAAAPGTAVDLVVRIRGKKVREYVAYLSRIFTRPAKDSTLRLRKLRPFLTKPRDGLEVDKLEMTKTIVGALKGGVRGPVELEATVIRPNVTKTSFGPIIVIRRESKLLYFYDGQRFVRRLGIATGQASYPTPLGRWEVVVKQRDPWWIPPPDSDWAQGAEPVPPGPGNPLGTRWMGLSAPLVGIHGTPDAASIGYSASHGCIRMRISDAEWLFERIDIGTPVYIVRA